MNERKPVMVDTGGFYAVYDEDDEEHDRADAVFRAVAEGDLAYVSARRKPRPSGRG
jgi:predicted nucleic acid-binding protein